MRKAVLCVGAFLPLLTPAAGVATVPGPGTPGAGDRCPTCGMFVEAFPSFLAQMVLADGSHLFFDGAKDMLRHYWKLKQEQPEPMQQLRALYVTEYYDVRPIDARRAFYVTGSDIYGPMGHELIAFETEEAALEFKRDHKGKALLRFEDVDPSVLEGLR